MPDGASIAYYDDVYGRDAARLAATSSANSSASGSQAKR
jgi:hypothetical protein